MAIRAKVLGRDAHVNNKAVHAELLKNDPHVLRCGSQGESAQLWVIA